MLLKLSDSHMRLTWSFLTLKLAEIVDEFPNSPGILIEVALGQYFINVTDASKFLLVFPLVGKTLVF